MAPVKKVATLIVSSEVPSAVAASLPASRHSPAMLLAMADRKMRPTSCTWPTAAGGHGAGQGAAARRGVGSAAWPGAQHELLVGAESRRQKQGQTRRLAVPRPLPWKQRKAGGTAHQAPPPHLPEKGSVLRRQNTVW